jgi:DNA-binding HxlR family transcriptional regulator
MYHYPETSVFAPNKTSFRIMKQLHFYFTKTKKGWAHISQAWLIEQLEKFEHQKVPKSTLNYNLRILEEDGFIQRQKRHMRDKVTGELIFRPSMYRITSKLRTFFASLAKSFERGGWTPSFRQLAQGFTSVLGACFTREAAFHEYRSQRFERERTKKT